MADKPDSGATISDEEVQALLDRAGPAAPASGEARPWDLAATQHISRGRLPTLELLHEGFARQFRSHLSDLIKREVQVVFEGVHAHKAADYMNALPSPACLEIARARPLPGQLLFAIEPALVFLLVDAFYGGGGRPGKRDVERGLTPTENRFARLIVKQASDDLAAAWQPVSELSFEMIKQERNAYFVDIAAPNDTLMVNRFRVTIPSGGGTVDFVIPATALEPLRETLASNASARHAAGGRNWAGELGAALLGMQVEVRAVVAEADITLRELVRLRPGDVIPIEAPREATLLSGQVPLYAARFGSSRGRNALTVEAPLKPRDRQNRN
jgi:flagellar motor switch protein FliM